MSHNPPFDEDTFHDYVTAHGLGEPTPEGYKRGRALFDSGDDYALAAAEIVANGLTHHAEEDRHETVTLIEAIELAKKEKEAGNIASYYIEDGKLYLESNDGGFYKGYDPDDWSDEPRFPGPRE